MSIHAPLRTALPTAADGRSVRASSGTSGRVGNWPDPMRKLCSVGNWPDPMRPECPVADS